MTIISLHRVVVRAKRGPLCTKLKGDVTPVEEEEDHIYSLFFSLVSLFERSKISFIGIRLAEISFVNTSLAPADKVILTQVAVEKAEACVTKRIDASKLVNQKHI